MAFVLTRDVLGPSFGSPSGFSRGFTHGGGRPGYTGDGDMTVGEAFKEAKAARREHKKAEEIGQHLMTTGLTVGTTFAFGLVEGYRQVCGAGENGACIVESGVPHVKDYPMLSADLLVGVGLHVASLLGYTKGKSDHVVQCVGNGALAFWGASLGTSLGHQLKKKMDEKKAKEAAAGGGAAKGYLDEGSREQLTADDVYTSQFR